MQVQHKISLAPTFACWQKSFSVLCVLCSQGLYGASVHGQLLRVDPAVIINEIMADPSPTVGLPDSEFVELYNRSDVAVDVSGWIFSDAVSSVSLPSCVLPADSYLIICSATTAEQFARYGRVLALTSLPSLNNAGDVITLRDTALTLIDSISYAVSWYRDSRKSDGGWSLERIDPDDFCGDGDNWIASDATEGGTPGILNSVFASRPDNRGPQLVSVVPTDPSTLLVTFNEKLSSESPAAESFHVRNGPTVDDARFYDALRSTVVLSLSAPLVSGKKYELTVINISDCPGNRIDPSHAAAVFYLPEPATARDVVLNEVLFNPRPTGFDFIEIFNRSDKVIDLQDWSLRNSQSATKRPFVVTRSHLLIHPGQFLVFTEDAGQLKGEYIAGIESNFFETDIPPLNDDEGTVALVDHQGFVIDSMRYSDDMHTPFLRDDEGVSLERISVETAGEERQNWRSASSISGFATPGYINSNSRPDVLQAAVILVEPEVIQAQLEFARIRYQFQTGGAIANVSIFDHTGRMIKTIAENELLGTSGFFRWDADTDEGQSASIGYYMVWFQIFDSSGNTATFRNRVAVF